MSTLLYQGHSSFRIITDEDKIIYIDPYAGKGYDLLPNYVFITHEHYDSNNLSLLNIAKDTKIIKARNCIEKDGSYNSFQDEFLKVISTPSGNSNHPLNECVGYILEFDNLKLYFAGDTSYLPFMSEFLANYHLDYAFLPTDGIYNMDVIEASKCAKLIKAKHSVPIDTIIGGLFSMDVAKKFDVENRLILIPNQEIKL